MYNRVYAVHCLRIEPRILCCCVIHIRCVFTWIYCQRSLNSAINDRCADLLRALPLLFTEKVASTVYPTLCEHSYIVLDPD